MADRRRPVRRSGGIRRARRVPGTWSRDQIIPTTVPFGSAILLSGLLLSNPGIGETVRRTVGQIFVRSDQVAAGEDVVGAFGMIVVSDPALAIGITAVPNPVDEESDDGWFVWQGLSATQGGSAGRTGQLIQFDSRAMRRVEEGFAIALVVANSAGAAGMVMFGQVSLYATRS